MIVFFTFLAAFLFSFIGSIPPGILNLTVVQLGLEKKISMAFRFSIAASLVEYPYAWLAVYFEKLITSSPGIEERLQLFAGIVMLIVGIINLLPSKGNSTIRRKFNESGFRRGLILGILNPLALPFWIATTAYLKSVGWISLDNQFQIQAFLIGLVLGAFTLLILFTLLAKYVSGILGEKSFVKRIPGALMVALGLYALYTYAF